MEEDEVICEDSEPERERYLDEAQRWLARKTAEGVSRSSSGEAPSSSNRNVTKDRTVPVIVEISSSEEGGSRFLKGKSKQVSDATTITDDPPEAFSDDSLTLPPPLTFSPAGPSLPRFSSPSTYDSIDDSYEDLSLPPPSLAFPTSAQRPPPSVSSGLGSAGVKSSANSSVRRFSKKAKGSGGLTNASKLLVERVGCMRTELVPSPTIATISSVSCPQFKASPFSASLGVDYSAEEATALDPSPMRLDKVDVSRFRYRRTGQAATTPANLFRSGAYSARDSSILASRASTGGSASESSLASTSASSSKSRTTISKSAAPLVLEIRQASLRNLKSCPSCSLEWTTYKAPSTKLSHIKKCSTREGLSFADILSRIADLERKMAEEARRMKTLFERQVLGKGIEVTVVGAELSEGGRRATSLQVQKEIDNARRKWRPVQTDMGMSMGTLEGKTFGHTQRERVQAAGRKAIGGLGGTDLTLDSGAVSLTQKAPVPLLPATQQFAPSKLATSSNAKANLTGTAMFRGITAQTNGEGLWALASSRNIATEGPGPGGSWSVRSSPPSINSSRGRSSMRRAVLKATTAVGAAAEKTADRSSRSHRRSEERAAAGVGEDYEADGEGVWSDKKEGEDVMPDFRKWTREALAEENKRWGYEKPAKTKATMVRRAEKGWKVARGLDWSTAESSNGNEDEHRPAKHCRSKTISGRVAGSKASPRRRCVSTSDSEASMTEASSVDLPLARLECGTSSADEALECQAPDFTKWSRADLESAHAKLDYTSVPKTKQALLRRVMQAWLDEHEGAVVPEKLAGKGKAKKVMEEEVAVGMRHICMDEQLWPRILRYEPIQFKIFKSRLESFLGDRAVKPELITQWLDSQAISFYIEDPTNRTCRKY